MKGMSGIGPFARKVYEALELLDAKSEETSRSADQVMKKLSLGKGQISRGLQELKKKGIVDRISKQKRAGYYIVKEI